MDAADERARRGAPAGVVVLAGQQTAGRGQRGRDWLAPAGTSLLMTLIARPDCRVDELPHLPAMVGRHLAGAVSRLTGLDCAVKLPNDLMIENRKVGGVLCQSSIEGQRVRYVLVGVGINVNISPDDLPLSTATSFLCETGQGYDLNDVLDVVLDELESCWCFSRSSPAMPA